MKSPVKYGNSNSCNNAVKPTVSWLSTFSAANFAVNVDAEAELVLLPVLLPVHGSHYHRTGTWDMNKSINNLSGGSKKSLVVEDGRIGARPLYGRLRRFRQFK
jgi:hypothetical protein